MATLDAETLARSTLRAKAVHLTVAPRDPIQTGVLGHDTLLGSDKQMDPQK